MSEERGKETGRDIATKRRPGSGAAGLAGDAYDPALLHDQCRPGGGR